MRSWQAKRVCLGMEVPVRGRMILLIWADRKTIRGMRSTKSKYRRVVWGMVLATAGPIGLAWVPGYRPQDLLARYWVAGFEQLPDAEVLPRLRQIARLGEDQIPAVTGALASRRRAHSIAARTVISEQLANWKLLSARQSTPYVHRLAVELARVVPELSDRNREFAAEVAQRLLDWPIQQDGGATVEMFVCCERILRAGSSTAKGLRRVPVKADGESMPDPSVAFSGDSDGFSNGDPRVVVVPAEELPPLVPLTEGVEADGQDFGDGSSNDGTSGRVVTSSSGAMSQSPAVAGRRKSGFRLADDNASDAADGGDQSPGGDEAMSDLPGEAVSPADDIAASSDEENRGDSGDEGSSPALEAPRKPEPSARDLIAQMRSENLTIASAAIRALRDRGFRDRDFELALRLTDPDSRVRLELIEQLPDIAGIDPVPWLLWLSEDESPLVRRSITALMATSSDPRLRARLRAMEVEDSDPEVIRLTREAKSRSQR